MSQLTGVDFGVSRRHTFKGFGFGFAIILFTLASNSQPSLRHSSRIQQPRKQSVKHAPSARCEAAYREFYSTDDLDFRVVFGYKDARPARLVTDRYELNWFIERILQIGFTRDTTDDEMFRFEMRGPDGKSKRIHLRVVQSSVGPDDEINRKDPFQAWQSEHARSIFLAGVKSSNAVLYVGHSRKGGGPDFAPPRLQANSHVDYEWYQKNIPGVRELKETMREMKSDRRLIGILSCDSSHHFSSDVLPASARNKRKVGIISNASNLYYSDSIADAVAILDSLIQRKCAPGFSPPGTHLRGFIN